jgi:hypothetical protein
MQVCDEVLESLADFWAEKPLSTVPYLAVTLVMCLRNAEAPKGRIE